MMESKERQIYRICYSKPISFRLRGSGRRNNQFANSVFFVHFFFTNAASIQLHAAFFN